MGPLLRQECDGLLNREAYLVSVPAAPAAAAASGHYEVDFLVFGYDGGPALRIERGEATPRKFEQAAGRNMLRPAS